MNLCKCGCKKEANYGNWIFGHWNIGKKAWNKGKSCGPLSKEHKLKIRISALGRKHTEEYKKKISILNSGQNNFYYGKFGNKHPVFGKKFIMKDTTKQKISRTLKGIPKSVEWRNKITGIGNPMYGKPAPKGSGRCQWFTVNNIKCQGTWERRFVEACFKWNIPVKRSQKRIYLKDQIGEFTYNPDFLINNNQIIEIKGQSDNRWLRKLPFISQLKIKVLYEQELKHFELTGQI